MGKVGVYLFVCACSRTSGSVPVCVCMNVCVSMYVCMSLCVYHVHMLVFVLIYLFAGTHHTEQYT